MSKSASSSESHAAVRTFMSIVLEALLTSVTCSRPPVSLKISQLSIVPAANSPAAARAWPSGICRKIQCSLLAEKYGSSSRPVRCWIRTSFPPWWRALTYSAVRRSCHTMARWTGLPDFRSQTTIVSRWFVIPIAAIPPGSTADLAMASRAVPRTDSQISAASCSTQPGCGKCCANSFCADASERSWPS